MANNGSFPPPSIPPYAAGAPIPPHQSPQYPAAPPYGGYTVSSPNPAVAGSAGNGFPPATVGYLQVNSGRPVPSIPPYAAGVPIPLHQSQQHPAAPPYGGYTVSSPNPAGAGSAGTGFPPNPPTIGATGAEFPPPGGNAPPPQPPQRSFFERIATAVLGHAVVGAIDSFISDVLEIVGYSET